MCRQCTLRSNCSFIGAARHPCSRGAASRGSTASPTPRGYYDGRGRGRHPGAQTLVKIIPTLTRHIVSIGFVIRVLTSVS